MMVASRITPLVGCARLPAPRTPPTHLYTANTITGLFLFANVIHVVAHFGR